MGLVLNYAVATILTPVDNVYCPTGKGGGIDPTCRKGGKFGVKTSMKTKRAIAKTKLARSQADKTHGTKPQIVSDWKNPTTNKEAAKVIVKAVRQAISNRLSDPATSDFYKDNPISDQELETNWGKKLRAKTGTGVGVSKVNGEIVSKVKEEITANENNEAYKWFEDKIGKPTIIVRHQTFDDAGAAEYRGGVIHVYDHSLATAELALWEQSKTVGLETKRDRFHMGDSGGLASVLRHEYGHQISDYLPAEANDRLRKIYNSTEEGQIKSTVSKYATTNYDEFFAETFTLITHPEYNHSNSPKFVTEFEKVLKESVSDYSKTK